MLGNINYYDIILTIIALLIGVIAFRVNIAFDVKTNGVKSRQQTLKKFGVRSRLSTLIKFKF